MRVVVMVVVTMVVGVARASFRGDGEHRQHGGDGDQSGQGHGGFFLLGEERRHAGSTGRHHA
jgi:hypothetical protein